MRRHWGADGFRHHYSQRYDCHRDGYLHSGHWHQRRAYFRHRQRTADRERYEIARRGGRIVIPGGIDVHTHLDMPFGGTTSATISRLARAPRRSAGRRRSIDFAIQYKGQTLRHALRRLDEKGRGKAAADYAFHCIITELGDTHMEEMGALVREGVSDFKLFMAYPGVFMLDDATIFRAMLQAAKHGGMICMHAENGGAIDVMVQRARRGKTAPKYHALTRPTTAEGEATRAPSRWPKWPGRPCTSCICRAMTRSKKCARRAPRIARYAETCPQYLHLSLENMDVPGFEGAKYVFTPPLREKWNQEKLWQGRPTTTLQVVSTDHCPFCMKEQKELGKNDFTKIPNGGPGVEHRLSLIYSGGVHGGKFSANRFVQLVSTAPAKLFGLYPRKGTIAVGSDADIVILIPTRSR